MTIKNMLLCLRYRLSLPYRTWIYYGSAYLYILLRRRLTYVLPSGHKFTLITYSNSDIICVCNVHRNIRLLLPATLHAETGTVSISILDGIAVPAAELWASPKLSGANRFQIALFKCFIFFKLLKYFRTFWLQNLPSFLWELILNIV